MGRKKDVLINRDSYAKGGEKVHHIAILSRIRSNGGRKVKHR